MPPNIKIGKILRRKCILIVYNNVGMSDVVETSEVKGNASISSRWNFLKEKTANLIHHKPKEVAQPQVEPTIPPESGLGKLLATLDADKLSYGPGALANADIADSKLNSELQANELRKLYPQFVGVINSMPQEKRQASLDSLMAANNQTIIELSQTLVSQLTTRLRQPNIGNTFLSPDQRKAIKLNITLAEQLSRRLRPKVIPGEANMSGRLVKLKDYQRPPEAKSARN